MLLLLLMVMIMKDDDGDDETFSGLSHAIFQNGSNLKYRQIESLKKA